MSKKSRFLNILATAWLCFAVSSTWTAAQVPLCMQRDQVVNLLQDQFSLGQFASGYIQGQIMELFVNDEGRWSILATRASGVSCLVAEGTHFQLSVQEAIGEDG